MELIDRARSGDAAAFAELIGPYRHEMQVHCYRILGSVADAEDALQETLVAAWRGIGGVEGRPSRRGGVYRIATNTRPPPPPAPPRRPPPGGPPRPPYGRARPARRHPRRRARGGGCRRRPVTTSRC